MTFSDMTGSLQLRQLSRLPVALRIAVIFLMLVVLTTYLAPLINSTDPLAMNPQFRLKPPSDDHMLGTDMFGRDIFTRVLYGGQVSLAIGVGTAALATTVGTILGLIAGAGQASENILMRIMDGMMAIPGILLAIALATIFGSGILTVIVALAVPEVPVVARLVRSLTLTLREQPFVEAAQSYGAGPLRILFKYILPNALAPIAVQATYIGGLAILFEAYLGFVGVGVPPEHPSWGNIVAEGRTFVLIAPHLIVYPSIVIAMVVLAINLIGDGLRDMLDPRFALPD
ncbi:ABC transporter permease [Rhizobium mesoamericanum]|uniref:Putative peptide transporter permease subunit: membrane component of ABC superfamily n=1 Tax=Rhizobium mesoamericanum STM3625 TaxID=1211777 RepID=K0PSX8_9HYPH|nr:ABC transporter permease [Rhizobium mesoamericanum]CCM79846.1 putative peptide transporter permease subunit: membrane component of ABC superfamily [Rhizobium mesoamericanum STM3625]